MDERGFHRALQVLLAPQVHHCVVDEDRVEEAAEPHGAHISLEVLTLRVQLPAHLQHVGREVDEGHLETSLEARGVVPTAASEL